MSGPREAQISAPASLQTKKTPAAGFSKITIPKSAFQGVPTESIFSDDETDEDEDEDEDMDVLSPVNMNWLSDDSSDGSDTDGVMERSLEQFMKQFQTINNLSKQKQMKSQKKYVKKAKSTISKVVQENGVALSNASQDDHQQFRSQLKGFKAKIKSASSALKQYNSKKKTFMTYDPSKIMKRFKASQAQNNLSGVFEKGAKKILADTQKGINLLQEKEKRKKNKENDKMKILLASLATGGDNEDDCSDNESDLELD